MSLESINFVPPTPEYTEDEKLTKTLESADFDLYDDETLNKAETQRPGFIEERAKKLARLPTLTDDDFIASAVNKFVSHNPEHVERAKDVFDREMDQPITGIEGQVETPPEVDLYIRDLLNILPRILKSEGAEKLTRFNPGRIVFIDPDKTDKEYVETLKANRAIPDTISGGTYFKQFDQVIVVDAKLLEHRTSLSFVLIHELIHALGFNSSRITSINEENKKINLRDRRSGIKSVSNDVRQNLLALNETVTEGLATKIAAQYGGVFPYVLDALNEEMEEMIGDDSFRKQVNEPVAMEIRPFKFKSGFIKKWKTVRDVSAFNYKIYTEKYQNFFSELSKRNNVPLQQLVDDLMPKLKDGYLNGRLLPFFRSLSKYGVSVKDLVQIDKDIIGGTKEDTSKKNVQK